MTEVGQEPVGGDPYAKTSQQVSEILRQNTVVIGAEGFDLNVAPAPTDRPSSAAFGFALTLSTAGPCPPLPHRLLDALLASFLLCSVASQPASRGHEPVRPSARALVAGVSESRPRPLPCPTCVHITSVHSCWCYCGSWW
jgi:hypothetical protein